MISTLSRRQFLATVAASIPALTTTELCAAAPEPGGIQLGMMLQGTSVPELEKHALAIAAAGFERVQLTFFFPPTAEDLQQLARTLRKLRLKTVAFGTYFNLFRPDDTGFMHSSQATLRLVAAHARLFDCQQFVTWSASHSPQFSGTDPRNRAPESVTQLQQAIRDVVLPVLAPIGGRVAFEPFFLHVVGTIELAQAVLAPFPAHQVGLVLDPPNFISPQLYPKRDDELRRLCRELADRFHLAHFKDLKLSATGSSVEYPGPGDGDQNYPLLISEIRRLKRPLPAVIEHIPAEDPALVKTKAWLVAQLGRD